MTRQPHKLLGIVCWIARLFGGTHPWRRLRKGETVPDFKPEHQDFVRSMWRICGRCGEFRSVQIKPRKAKATP